MILITMAGASSRFTSIGYEKKWKLPLAGKSVLRHVLEPIYQKSDEEIYLVYDSIDSKDVDNDLKEFFPLIKAIDIKGLSRGQSETAYMGLQRMNSLSKSERLIIWNIDTLRNDWEILNSLEEGVNYFQCFERNGDQWSFAKIDSKSNVIETTEKVRISKWCSTGLYIFESIQLYEECFVDYYGAKYSKSEMYIAPMFNWLIKNNRKVKMINSSDVEMLSVGIPEEYEAIKNNWSKWF